MTNVIKKYKTAFLMNPYDIILILCFQYKTMQLSVVTFNTQGTPFFSPDITARYKTFSKLLNKENPDIICFQEIATYYHLWLLKKYLNYPYFIYKNSFHGPKGGLVIASKVPLEYAGFKNFTTLGSFNNISFISRIVQNGMLLATVKDQSLLIINTHTFSDFEFEWSPTNQLYRYVKAQVEQIASEVKEQKDNYDNLILTGDFNMKKNSRLYKYLLKETGVTDIFKTESIPTYYKERLDYKFPGKISDRIDFIFITSKTKKKVTSTNRHLFTEKVLLSNKTKSFLSDHIGLQAIISFEK